MKKIILAIITLAMVGCNTNEKLRFAYVPNFNWNVLDSLQYKNKPLSFFLDPNLTSVIYISNNECAECIYNFIKFNKSSFDIDENIQYIYIITGLDYNTFTYYLKENDVTIKNNSYLIIDSLDTFHQNMSEYIGNHIFVLKENRAVIQLLSNPIKNKYTFKNFQKLIKK